MQKEYIKLQCCGLDPPFLARVSHVRLCWALYYLYTYTSHINLDVDECLEGTDTCAQTCTNVVGSYTCSCDPGYRLGSDNRQCSGKKHDIDMQYTL